MKRVKPALGSTAYVRERVAGRRGHVARALGHAAADLVGRVAHRPAHLPRQLLAELGLPGLHRRDEARDDRLALGEGRLAPRALRDARRVECRRDLCAVGERALDIDPSVDGRDGLEGHGSNDLEIPVQFPV
jgi:hypothetical protein